MALWTLIRQGIKNIKDCDHETFLIETDRDDLGISVRINHISNRLLKAWPDEPLSLNEDLDGLPNDKDDQRSLYYALYLLQQSSAGVEIIYDGETEILTLRVPYHHNR